MISTQPHDSSWADRDQKAHFPTGHAYYLQLEEDLVLTNNLGEWCEAVETESGGRGREKDRERERPGERRNGREKDREREGPGERRTGREGERGRDDIEDKNGTIKVLSKTDS